MATATANYAKLRAFLNAFPSWVDVKNDLLKIKDKSLLKDYYLYRAYFNIDKRLKPYNVILELKKFKRDNIYFKSEELGIDLVTHSDFDSYDLYTSSQKLIAKVTKAMLDKDVKLNSIASEYKTFDVRYKVSSTRKVVTYDSYNNQNVDFMRDLSDTTFINISKADGYNSSAYNKNGLDFIYDYNNQSNDFSQNLAPMVEDLNLFIYNY